MSDWNEEPVVFDCEGDRLVGILHRGTNPAARIGVLVVVGGPQYRVGSHRQFVIMARELAAAGYPVLRFDYRGMGDADGDDRTFESIDVDLLAALVAFERAVPELRGVVIWGLCDAASAIMMNTTLPRTVTGKVLVNPWVRTPVGEARAYVRHYYLRRIFQRTFWRKLWTGGLDVRNAARQFVDALQRAVAPLASMPSDESPFIDRMLRGATAFSGPTLVVLSGRDLTAREFEAVRGGIAGWREVLDGPRYQYVTLEDADHTFSERRMLDAGTRATLDWIESIDGVQA